MQYIFIVCFGLYLGSQNFLNRLQNQYAYLIKKDTSSKNLDRPEPGRAIEKSEYDNAEFYQKYFGKYEHIAHLIHDISGGISFFSFLAGVAEILIYSL